MAAGEASAAAESGTWVWMSRNSTGRSEARPLGRESLAGVRAANIMAARVVLLVELLIARGVMVVLEQPRSSLFAYSPRFQDIHAAFQLWALFNLGKVLKWRCVRGARARGGRYGGWGAYGRES